MAIKPVKDSPSSAKSLAMPLTASSSSWRQQHKTFGLPEKQRPSGAVLWRSLA